MGGQRKCLTVSDITVMISDMKTTQIERKIEHRKQQVAEARAHASGQFERAVQRLRETGLSLQRREEPAEARALLPTQFHLARQGPNSVRECGALGEGAAEDRQLQTSSGTTDEWVDLVVELEQQEREQNR